MEVRPDVGRGTRTGMPEVVYAEGKTPAQTVAAVLGLRSKGVAPVLVSRASAEHAAAVLAAVPTAEHHPRCGMVVVDVREHDRAARASDLVVVTAGTSDLRVAEECSIVLEAMGQPSTLLSDVGVAGLHRVLDVVDTLSTARVVIVIAGMEAALATVVAGLVPAPVIAVPTSVGYGAAQGGMTALHGLLTSCAPGIAVMNIDNGVGAAAFALRVLSMGNSPRSAAG